MGHPEDRGYRFASSRHGSRPPRAHCFLQSNQSPAGSTRRGAADPSSLGNVGPDPSQARTSWESTAVSFRFGTGGSQDRRTRSVRSRIVRPLQWRPLGTRQPTELWPPHRVPRRILVGSVPWPMRRGSTNRHAGAPAASCNRVRSESLRMVEVRSSPSREPAQVLPGGQPRAQQRWTCRSQAIQ